MNLILYVFIIILFLFSDFVNNNNKKKLEKKIITQKNKYNSKLHKKTFYPSLSFLFVSYVIIIAFWLNLLNWNALHVGGCVMYD